MISAIELYQCPGCVSLPEDDCFEKSEDSLSCINHVPGTIYASFGKIFLGVPKGFNRLGPYREMKMVIFRSFTDGFGYGKFNIPVWKYKNEKGHTLVRGLSPRLNTPFLHIFLEDCISKINCVEIKNSDISNMD